MTDGKDPVTGRFLPGHKLNKPRVVGSRNKLTQRMLDTVAARSEDGLTVEDILLDIAQDPAQPVDLRLKAASKIADLVYPKASSVEVKMEESDTLNKEQIDARLQELISAFVK